MQDDGKIEDDTIAALLQEGSHPALPSRPTGLAPGLHVWVRRMLQTAAPLTVRSAAPPAALTTPLLRSCSHHAAFPVPCSRCPMAALVARAAPSHSVRSSPVFRSLSVPVPSHSLVVRTVQVAVAALSVAPGYPAASIPVAS
jgi:hypothetical protein